MTLESKIPAGDIATKWTQYKSTVPLVNPANKRQLEIIVVGTGLAGASAAATLAEMGYKVKAFCFQDSPRRAHSIAAQGGINAAKNYQNDGDSVYRLFYDSHFLFSQLFFFNCSTGNSPADSYCKACIRFNNMDYICENNSGFNRDTRRSILN